MCSVWNAIEENEISEDPLFSDLRLRIINELNVFNQWNVFPCRPSQSEITRELNLYLPTIHLIHLSFVLFSISTDVNPLFL